MASDVGIVNAALAKLGLRSILSFGDDRTEARLATDTYADLRDAVLRDHPWNFATQRAAITAETDTPVWGYGFSYPWPEDPYCLRILDIKDIGTQPFKIEGRKILTDVSSPINILFVSRVTDPNVMDVLFRDALAARIAMEWAEKLTRSTQVQEAMHTLYKSKLKSAKSTDGMEGSVEPVTKSRWIDVRW